MITLLVTFVLGHIGLLAGLFAGALGVAFGGVRHLQAKAATADAQKQIAQAQRSASQAQASADQANASAAQETAKASDDRAVVDAQVQSQSSEATKNALDQWTR